MTIEEKIDELHSSWQEVKSVFNNNVSMIKKQNAEIDSIKSAISRPSSGHLEFEDSSYKEGFSDYLKKGSENNIDKSDFGYQVTRRMFSRIKNYLECHSIMRQISNVTEISGDSLELIEGSGNFAGWSKDADKILNSKDNKTSASKISIPLHELYGQIEVTQKLLDDKEINIEDWISDELIRSFFKAENQAFINGSGEGEPEGILAKNSKIDIIEEKAMTSESLSNIFFKLNDSYSKNAKFLMNRSALKLISNLRNSQKEWDYIWRVNNNKNIDTIFGREIIECGEVPTNETLIIFGDFKSAYQIVDRVGVDLLRDPYTSKPNTRFYSMKRVGGKVINPEAIKILKVKSA
ncbi:Phage capsid family protein [Candidatus Cyrtobacter comes]|uniref:Phage capsid family protein n=1 Tax=Candidatus Cyrtobacter comes TaxID=675776 RepID=A0ABU5L8U5_9RICK|nr:phage major capsid protein [Candidatus Cyrtobacter comes]MDZ5762457.1 Phage capsid family protein [Candidatus Cyrtobacter comes]